MKDYKLILLISALLLNACGQTGPLYLPTDKPPIHVEEMDENEDEDE